MDEDGPAPKDTRVPCRGVPEVFWGPSAVLGTLRCHGDPAVLWDCCARTSTGSSTRSWRNAWGTLREKERAPRSQGHFKGLQEKPRGSRLCLLPLRGHAAAGRSAVMLHGQHPAHIEVHGTFWGAKTCWGAGAGCPPGRIQPWLLFGARLARRGRWERRWEQGWDPARGSAPTMPSAGCPGVPSCDAAACPHAPAGLRSCRLRGQSNSKPRQLAIYQGSILIGKRGLEQEESGDTLCAVPDLFRVLLIESYSPVSWLLWIFIKGDKQGWDLGLS